MCGLVGLINKRHFGFNKEQQSIFSELLFVDYVRGNDSTGVFLVSNNGDVAVAKEASNPIDFMSSDDYGKIMTKAFRQGSAIIGHNRKATRGVINDDNAHPFIVEDKIILAHNGTVYGDHKKMADVEVDSHAIAHSIYEHQENPEEAIKKLDAAYALIWYDFDKGQLNLIRNAERPLWFMETQGEWIWASERSMLNFVKDRFNLTTIKDPTPLVAGDLQRFTLEKKGGWSAGYTTLNFPQKRYGHTAMSKDDWEFYYSQQGRRFPMLDDDDDLSTSLNAVMDAPVAQKPPQPSTNHVQTTSDFERRLARQNLMIIRNKRFLEETLNNFPHDAQVLGSAIAYCYANQVDITGGYYLYLMALDDTDVLIRIFMDSKHFEESRIKKFVEDQYVFKATIARRRWGAFSPSLIHGQAILPAAEGFAVMEADKPLIVHGGDIVSAEAARQAGLTH